MISVSRVHRPTELFQIQSLVLSSLFSLPSFAIGCNTVVKIVVVKGKDLRVKENEERGIGSLNDSIEVAANCRSFL